MNNNTFIAEVLLRAGVHDINRQFIFASLARCKELAEYPHADTYQHNLAQAQVIVFERQIAGWHMAQNSMMAAAITLALKGYPAIAEYLTIRKNNTMKPLLDWLNEGGEALQHEVASYILGYADLGSLAPPPVNWAALDANSKGGVQTRILGLVP